MALVLKDRVKQTAAAPGTGTITLSGSVTGFQSFSAVGNGNSTYFAIYDPISGAWEVNYGTYTSSGTTLTRNATPLSSSNSGSLVNFTNAVDVFVTYPSENAVWRDTSGVVVQQSFGAITATSAALTSGTVTAAPTNATDIVNKEYADSISSGLNYHQPANYASTAALPTYTYNNGASGVGATITATANGALSLGGGSPTATQRVLVKDEIGGNAAYNGIYVVTQAGTSLLPFILTRATDYDTSGVGTNEIDQGDYVLVISGTLASTAWVQQTPLPITVGTTALTFLQFNAPITYYAGTGLTLSPATTFNIATTGVTAATYGSASSVPVITVNSQGQATVITNTAIAINGSAVSGNISGSAGSVANALTAGTYLTSGGTYNGSAARTFAVDATDANTASKVVARDASGNFSAGTITATLSGAATSATTATNIAGGAANQIPYQTGAATTSFVTAPTVAGTYLNWSGSALAWSAISLPNNATFNNGGTGDASGTTFNGSAARTISYNTVGASPLAGSSSLTTTGTVTSGTWSASFGAVSGANLISLTAGNLSGTIPSAVLGNSTAYVGTTAVALNRASANQALTGISSITLPGATSGSAQITPNAVAGTGTVLTLPATTGTLALTSDLPTVNNATLTMNTSGTGLSGSQTFTANQATGATFTVASNATNANTASTIVARDASGNFSAGTITATLTGQASSVANSLTAGTYLSGTAYNGSAAQTWTVDATSANTASKVVARDASGNFSAGTITASLSGTATTAGGLTGTPNITVGTISTTGITATGDITTYRSGSPTTGVIYLGNNSATRYLYYDGANYYLNGANLYVNSNLALTAGNYNSYAPTLTGTGASGTWSINVTGNAATATLAANSTLAGGLAIASGVNSSANQIVRTNGSGYCDFGWINTVSGTATGTPARVYCSEDAYIRYYSMSTFTGYVQAAASGSWGINVTGSSASCTGNAATATNATNATNATYSTYLNSKPSSAFWQRVHYGTSAGNTGYYKISILPATSWMLSFTIRMYQGYQSNDIRISGYNYGSNYWYTPEASLMDSSTTSIDVRFGYDSAYNLWVAVPAGNYTGLDILNIVNGYTQVDQNWSDQFTIVNQTSLTGTVQTTVTAYRPVKYNEALRTDNYSSYAMPIGSSATNSVDVRAPIFYDSNNTAYYADLNNTSTALSIAGSIVFGISNPYITASSYITMSGGAYFSSGTVYMEANLKARGGVGNDSASALTLTGGTSGYTQINGSARSPIFYDSDNTGYYVDPASTSRMNTVNADSLYSYGNVTAYSDERLKKDWEELPTNFVEELAKVKSGTYTRIDSGERQVGVGAQSLQAILKEAVSEKEEYLGVHYGNAAMVSAVELAKEVVDLRARVAQLETLVNKLIKD